MAASSSPTSSSASVRCASPAASNGTCTAPSQSDPRPTCATPTRSTAYAMDRAIQDGSTPPDAVSQKPMPMTPPVLAMPSRCASDRLRALSQTPRTPVCDATTGRVATASASSIVAAEAWATSRITPRASMRRIMSRPSSVRPPWARPWALPPKAVSKKCDGEIIRIPASATTSTLAGSSSSAWAPSIERTPAVSDGLMARSVR